MEPNQPPSSPSQPPQEIPPQRLKLYLGITGIVALGLLAAVCWIVPSESHKLEQAKEDLRKSVLSETQWKQVAESYKATVSTMKRSRRTRTIQKVALDGQGKPVMKADGNPLVLEMTTAISGSEGSSSSTEATRIQTEYQAKLDAKEAYIKELLKKEDIKRGQGWAVVGSYGSRGTAMLDATGSLGILRLGAGGAAGTKTGEVEGFARVGLGW